MSVYLENMDSLISYDEELLNRLTNACNTDELHNAKRSVLRDFRDIYAFDVSNAEFPEPIGHFDDEKEKANLSERKYCCRTWLSILAACTKSTILLFIRRIIDCRRSN